MKLKRRKICIDEAALRAAAAKLRKLRMTDVQGRKESPSTTVKHIFELGLGGLYDDEAIVYMLGFGIKYYLEIAAEHGLSDGPVLAMNLPELCDCGEQFPKNGKCDFCGTHARHPA